jgi:hypothetical protein
MTAHPNSPVIAHSPNPGQPAAGATPADGVPPNADASPLPKTGPALWAYRASAVTFVFLCAVMGVLLIIVPWWPQWTDNHFLLGHAELRAVMASGFVRGLCSGLGLLDVWIGFWQAVHYHEEKRP